MLTRLARSLENSWEDHMGGLLTVPELYAFEDGFTLQQGSEVRINSAIRVGIYSPDRKVIRSRFENWKRNQKIEKRLYS